MANGRTGKVLRHLRGAVALREGAGMTDGQLLDCFVTQRDDAAFAALVRRHGPMVWGVCRRVLRNYHDAEDAFQAAFLVLVRRAAAIEPRAMVANWLHGVAYQTALKARSVAARRRERERQVMELPEPAVEEREVWHDLRPLLDQELSRLPDRYRVPVVLCDLEGKTRKEAARQLGWPEGTVAGRLATARRMLASRLARRGVALPAGALAVVLSQKAPAGVPALLVSSTIKAASLLAAGPAVSSGVISPTVAALTEGVLKTMLPNKLKVALAVMLVTVVAGFGAGALRYRTQAAEPAAPSGPVTPALLAQKADGKSTDGKEPDLGYYPPDKRLIGTQKKARAQSFAKLQTLASIEESLKKFRESTDDKAEREALDRMERAILWYRDARWLIEELSSVEKEAVPFPVEKKPGEKKE